MNNEAFRDEISAELLFNDSTKRFSRVLAAAGCVSKIMLLDLVN